LAPGDNVNVPDHGQMAAVDLTLDSSSDFNIDLAGPAATGKYDQLSVAGSVTLSNAAFHLTQSSSGKSNDVFTIVKNVGAAAVKGTFNGLPEGSVISISPLQKFKLSYVGGASGHDVILTQISSALPSQITNITRSGNGQIQLTGSGVIGQP